MTCDTGLSCGHSASHLPREAPWPQQGGGRFRLRQTAHLSRILGTAIPGEDCDFPQMTEVSPASSVGERSPRRESTFSISPPGPAGMNTRPTAGLSQHIRSIRTLTGRTFHNSRRLTAQEHTPRPGRTSQVTLDLWTIRSLPDRC